MANHANDPLRRVNPSPIVRVLIDPIRLMVAGALTGPGRTAAEVADHTGVDERDVIAVIAELRQVELVEQIDRGFRLPPASVRRIAVELIETDVPSAVR